MRADAIIRRPTPADAQALAEVHVASWRTTYKGIMAQSYLDQLEVSQRLEMWELACTHKPQHVLVAEVRGQVVGFAFFGKGREQTGYAAELYAIYLLQEWQGHGLGRALMQACAAALQERGLHSLYLWVVKGNPSARFYAHMGGEPFGEKEFELGGQVLTEIGFGWSSVTTLVGS